MQQQISMIWERLLAGQVTGIVLLEVAVVLFLYVLPSVLAFMRGQKSFWIILVPNILLTFVQGLIFHQFFPGLFALAPGDMAGALRLGVLVNFGPGWLALLIWSLMHGDIDQRLVRARNTKTYDVIAALPLILWFAYGALQLRAALAHDGAMISAGTASLFIWVRFCSLLAAIAFNLLLIYLLVVRDKPVAKSRGVTPRIFAFLGTFMGVSILGPVPELSLPLQILAAVLVGLGSLASFLVLWRLGKSFSIMPEARKLVTGGPYAYARHPLYAVEMITIVGMALQFSSPRSWIMAGAVLCLLWIRSHFEEQVLADAFPEYGAYRARTKRFVPGVL